MTWSCSVIGLVLRLQVNCLMFQYAAWTLLHYAVLCEKFFSTNLAFIVVLCMFVSYHVMPVLACPCLSFLICSCEVTHSAEAILFLIFGRWWLLKSHSYRLSNNGWFPKSDSWGSYFRWEPFCLCLFPKKKKKIVWWH